MNSPLMKMVEGLSPEKRRLLRECLLPASEPIAIVGMACRFPEADGPDAYWKLLSESGDAVSEVPPERWDVDRYFQAGEGTPGKTNSRWGGFVRNVDKFDAKFFGISPREAIAMDPQHRLLLEIAWEAFENAGETKERLAGSSTGIFVGIGACEYSQLRSRNAAHIDLFSGTGVAGNIAAGRLSYFFDLKGPSVSIDTACSSSLVAVHYAVQSLRNGECDIAFAAGVNAILSPWMAILATQMRATAADGRCKAFDARADGYVRGEGCGAVVLKRLSDARRSSDRILAVISGSAVNQDGRSASLTAPNPLSQRDVVTNALTNARASPHEISFIEAHGTGTALGDPIELEALKSVFGVPRQDGSRCAVGSVKTNIGHLEAAAGIASLIKTVLALGKETIPPNLHFKTLNTHVSLDDTSLFVPNCPVPWPRSERRRLAGISSFGWSGTNAHLIVAEAPEPSSNVQDEDDRDHIVLISARSTRALNEAARAYRDIFSDAAAAGERLGDVAYTTSMRRTHHDCRLALIGNSRRALASQLDTFLGGSRSPARSRMPNGHSASRIALVFSGYGSQWAGMGTELAREEPVFRAMLDACEREFSAHVSWSLSEQLRAASGHSVFETSGAIDVVQPAIFAIQCALFALLRSWGISPGAVVGHSMGEIAAAYASGALDLSDAARIICHRSRLIQVGSGTVGMAQINAPAQQVEPEIERYSGRLSIAAVNQPGSTLIAGDLSALDELIDQLSKVGLACQRLNVSGASHCPQTDVMVPELMRALEGVQAKATTSAQYSTVLGRKLTNETLSAEYWGANLRKPVQFSSAIDRMLADGYTTFIEVSPRALLGDTILANARGREIVVLPTLRKGRRGRAALLHSLGQLFELGHTINWSALHPNAGRVIDLPRYAWQRQRYWLDEREELQDDEAPVREVQHIAQHAPEFTPDVPAGPFLSVSWERTHEPRRLQPSPLRQHWLILTDEGGIGNVVRRKLTKMGADCTTVRPASAYKEAGDGFYEARTWSRDDLVRIIEAVQRNCEGKPICVAYFWALDIAPPHWNERAEEVACSSIINLISVLGQRAGSTARLFLVTKGAECLSDPTDGGISVPAQALVHGLARTIRIELPELRCISLDLDSSDTEVPIDRIVEELIDPDEEEEIALRHGERFVRRLARVLPSKASSYTPRPHGTYLIVGGLGGLGLRIARWLTTRGARCLVLVGRSGPTATSCEQIAQMRSDGAQVIVRTADVTRIDQLSPIFDEIDSCLPPLAGVVHAAGVVKDALLVNVQTETIPQVIGPKVRGAWNLHMLTQGRELDLFILFSSAASLFGSPTQGVYAAANAFLDALAHYRRGRGVKGLSINWGPWSDVGGAVARPHWMHRLETFGIGSLPADDAINALERAIVSDSAQLAIVDFHYTRLLSVLPVVAAKPFYAKFGRGANSETSETSEPSSQLLDSIAAERSAAGRRQLLESYLQMRVGEVLRTPPADIACDAPLLLFGIDSLTSMELRAVLERELGTEIPARLAWSHPTIEAIAAFLEAEITGRYPIK